MNKVDVLLVGPFRRTRVGGIRSHVRRIRSVLDGERIRTAYIDPKTREVIHYIWQVWFSKIVHLHNSNGAWTMAMAIWAKLAGRMVIATVHGELDHFSRSSRLGFIIAGRIGTRIVALNRSTAAMLARYGVGCEVQSAYLPLSPGEIAEKEVVTRTGMKRMEPFCAGYSRCFLTYSFGGGAEHRLLYGIDALIDLFSQMPGHGLIILVNSDPEPVLRATDRFANILVLTGDMIVPWLLAYADGLIRNTASDGDSLIVREALASSAEVFATDVVDRPTGTTVYRQHDMDSLRQCILAPRRTPAVAVVNGAEKRPDIVRLYDRLLGKA